MLLRAYGNNTEILIDREREAKSHALLAEYALAPPLLARFENGLLYKFIRGQVCTPQELTRRPVWRGVARRLGEWHARLPLVTKDDFNQAANGSPHSSPSNSSSLGSSEISDRSPAPNVWSIMQKWVSALPSKTETQKTRRIRLQDEIERSFDELDNANGLGNSGVWAYKRLTWLELMCWQFVFAHTDLLSANVIVLPEEAGETDTETETVNFIDYEYATPAPAAFDIANHFAEWAGYDCDYNRLGTRSVRREFLKEYLEAYKRHLSPGTEIRVDDTEVRSLFDDVDRYRGMPGLYWGIWALIQATISHIDFDYASYAEIRLGEYWAWRAETDGSREREQHEMPLRERRWAQEA